MELQAEQTVCNGKYRLIKRLGRGGYGEVWLADELTSKSQKALKIAHRDNREALSRFTREKELSSQLDHPNLVTTHTVDPNDDTFYMVMPYLAGGNLAQKLKQGALPLLEAAQIAAQIAAGLGHLHQRDWVHRDIHPGNILFNNDGVAKLSDFGLVQTPDTSVTLWYGERMERHPGNIYYQPPEAMGEMGRPLAPLYPSSDVYMLGAVLWELLTGKSYYHHRRKSLSELRPEAPNWLADLVGQCLQREAENRPFDGVSVAQLLEMGATQLAKASIEQEKQAQQRRQAELQQTLIQKTQAAINQQDWPQAEEFITELKAQGSHTDLATILLQQQLWEKQEKQRQEQQQQELNELVSSVKKYLTHDPNNSLAYIAEIERAFPDYPALPQLKQEAKAAVIKQVTGKHPLFALNPISWITLLWWLFVTPEAYNKYLDLYGEDSLDQTGTWLSNTLIYLPIFLLWVIAVGKTFPIQASDNLIIWITTHWYWALPFLGVVISWSLTGFTGTERTLYSLWIKFAFVLTFTVGAIVTILITGLATATGTNISVLITFVILLFFGANVVVCMIGDDLTLSISFTNTGIAIVTITSCIITIYTIAIIITVGSNIFGAGTIITHIVVFVFATSAGLINGGFAFFITILVWFIATEPLNKRDDDIAVGIALGIAFFTLIIIATATASIAGGIVTGIVTGLLASICGLFLKRTMIDDNMSDDILYVIRIIPQTTLDNINNGRSSWWVLLILAVAYGVMIWQAAAAWLL